MLAAAAALAGAYQEPMVAARQREDVRFLVPGLVSKNGRVEKLDDSNCHRGYDFLRQFAVCNTDAKLVDEEDVFGPVASWLYESILSDSEARAAMAKRFREGYGRALCCSGRPPPCPIAHLHGLSHSDAHLVAWELAQIVTMAKIAGEHVRHPFRSPAGLERPRVDCQAVLFGVFNTEDVDYQALSRPPPNSAPPPVARLCRVPFDAAKEYCNEINACGQWGNTAAVYSMGLKQCSGQPNYGSNGFLAPLELKFFDCFARRYLGLQLLSFDAVLDWATLCWPRCLRTMTLKDARGAPWATGTVP